MTRFCSKCQQVIRKGEAFTEHAIDSGSAAAATIYWHEVCPKSATRR